MFGGLLVFGVKATVAVAEQPILPPPVRSGVSRPIRARWLATLRLSPLGYTPYQDPYFALHRRSTTVILSLAPTATVRLPIRGHDDPRDSPATPVIIQNTFVPPKSAAKSQDQVAQAPLDRQIRSMAPREVG